MIEAEISAVITALGKNHRVEILFIHALARMTVDHLKQLLFVLKRGHIWALNIGETNLNFRAFVRGLRDTNVAYMYIDCNFIGTKLKEQSREAIRWVRERSPVRDLLGRSLAGKMWHSPLLKEDEGGRHLAAEPWMSDEVAKESVGAPNLLSDLPE